MVKLDWCHCNNFGIVQATSSNPIIISFDVNNASSNQVLKPMVDETNIWWKRKHGNEKGATQRTCLMIEPGRGRSKPAQYIKVFCIFTYACVLVYAVPKIPGPWSVEFHRNSLSNLQKTFPFVSNPNPLQGVVKSNI